jgi:hypothetical protein
MRTGEKSLWQSKKRLGEPSKSPKKPGLSSIHPQLKLRRKKPGMICSQLGVFR